MSTIKTDAIVAVSTNGNLDLSGQGTGGVKVSDYLVLTKGADIASATALTLGKDGSAFDVTGTTAISSIGTQGIGSHVTLHFDGALTFTHHATDLILPGAANITTAAGDIAVMYEYASGDWRCVSYTKASGAAVVSAGGGWVVVESVTLAGESTVDLAEAAVTAGYDFMIIGDTVKMSADPGNYNPRLQFGSGAGPTYQTSGYKNQHTEQFATTNSTLRDSVTTGIILQHGGFGPGPGGTGAGETLSWIVEIINPAASVRCNCYHHSWSSGLDGTFIYQDGAGHRTTAEVITGFRLLPNGSQTFDTGTIIIYKRARS